HHQLLVLTVQRIERMEEFLLRGLFPGDELNVVNQEDVNVAVLVPKRIRGMGADRIDQVVGEIFGGNVKRLQPARAARITNGLEQVRLAQPHAAIQEER